ncbi:helix-turn-helix domain-containing protein [Methylobacterium radiodurans]|uniref:AraC family transcriptional regulator n=1 Tax=Methylobacterium radiodurans TaxID=2202828 RepID=A0A2U8VU12_9HYPH|nr:helix-turn-helix domain-containing protein [Methylobacterium radiodurans]AWN37197.1 AraC family transcriptional regulator [Methylobacterium radiodurans]
MRKIFTTVGLHPRDRFDYWMSVIRRDIIENDAVPARRRAFRAELRAGAIGGIKLALARSSELRISHTKRHSGQPSDEQLFVFMPLSGTKTLRQNGRQAVLEPGQVALVDPRLPHEGCFSEDSEVLTVILERRALESRLGAIHDLTARPLTSGTAEGRLAAGYLAMLPPQAGRLRSAAEDMVETHLLDLLALALGKAAERRVSPGSSTRSLVRMRLHAAIEEMLADPGLDTEAVAAAAGVSTRHANAILADEDTSLGRLIQARRLARCRDALEDPSQMHRTVSEIAYGWGFSDMTHFGRRFRAAYGILPSACRRQARARS